MAESKRAIGSKLKAKYFTAEHAKTAEKRAPG
jgi:hypothetical protein